MLKFIKALSGDEEGILRLSAMASEIVKDYYDSIIGPEQNDYMIEKFQSPEGLKRQLDAGHSFYTVEADGKRVGFFAFYPKAEAMYISKLYFCKTERGKGFAKEILKFVSEAAERKGLHAIELNVNKRNPSVTAYEKLGFKRIRSEKIDIGGGYFMDDYVYRLDLNF